MAGNSIQLQTFGRLVQGSAMEPHTKKDNQGRPKLTQAGHPKIVWFMGVAVAKGPELDVLIQQIVAKAALDFPSGESGVLGFAWKFIDGDLPENAAKEGFPGHVVFRFETGYAPRCYDAQPQPQQIIDAAQIKRGCYVQVQFSCEGNRQIGAQAKPGVYLSQSMVMVLGYGAEITSGPPPEQVFANRHALPAGATLAPPAPAPIAGPVGVPLPAPLAQPVPVVQAAPITPQYVPGGVPGATPLAAPAVSVPGAPPLPPGMVPGIPVQPTGYGPVVAGVPVPAPIAPNPAFLAPQPAAAVPGAVPGAVAAPAPVGAPVAAVPGVAVPGAPGAPLAPINPVTGLPYPPMVAPGPAPINPATGLPYPPPSDIPF